MSAIHSVGSPLTPQSASMEDPHPCRAVAERDSYSTTTTKKLYGQVQNKTHTVRILAPVYVCPVALSYSSPCYSFVKGLDLEIVFFFSLLCSLMALNCLSWKAVLLTPNLKRVIRFLFFLFEISPSYRALKIYICKTVLGNS